jgi:hypothetical protein
MISQLEKSLMRYQICALKSDGILSFNGGWSVAQLFIYVGREPLSQWWMWWAMSDGWWEMSDEWWVRCFVWLQARHVVSSSLTASVLCAANIAVTTDVFIYDHSNKRQYSRDHCWRKPCLFRLDSTKCLIHVFSIENCILFYFVTNECRVIVRSCMQVIGYSAFAQSENSHNAERVTVIVHLSKWVLWFRSISEERFYFGSLWQLSTYLFQLRELSILHRPMSE